MSRYALAAVSSCGVRTKVLKRGRGGWRPWPVNGITRYATLLRRTFARFTPATGQLTGAQRVILDRHALRAPPVRLHEVLLSTDKEDKEMHKCLRM